MSKENESISEKIIRGLELTYKRLILSKIEKNQKLVISRNGKVEHVDPREFLPK